MNGAVQAIRRGDVFWADMDPARGSEITKTRPAIVVSNDGVNTAAHRSGRGVITMVPISSNIARVFPFQVLIEAIDHPGLRNDSKALVEQVRTVDVSRLGRRITALNPVTMLKLDAALRRHLLL